MKQWLAPVGSGLVSAAAAAFIFFWVNNAFRMNGVGWLQQFPFPINTPWFWSAVAFPIGMVGALIQGARRSRHVRIIREQSEESGYTYEESYDLPRDAFALPVFKGWSSGRHAMTSRTDEFPITVFDCTMIIGIRKSNNSIDRTIALLNVGELPSFDLVPRTIELRLRQIAGIEGLTFDPESASSTDAETIHRFAKLFLLSQGESLTLWKDQADNDLPQPDREKAIRRLFTPAVMELVNQYPSYAIQSRPGFLAIWRGVSVLPAPQRNDFVAAARELRNILTHPHDFGTGPVVSGRAGTDSGKQARKIIHREIGEGIGFFAGFIVSAILMPLLVFQQGPGPGPGPGLGFVAMPFVFMGCIFAGRKLGSVIGLMWPAGNVEPGPPEDQTVRGRRMAATGCASLVGFFGGFFGGGILFGQMIANQQQNFGVTGALFFGSIFGGALFGAVTCGTVVNRLYHWRQSWNPPESPK